MSINDAVI